jgi:hypothetical protein
MAHLPSKQSAAASNAQLGQLWRAAGRPAQRTGRVTEEATRLANSQNQQPLAIQHVRPLGEAAADAGTVWYRQHATALSGSGADDPFALISDTEYEASAAQYQAAKKAGLPIGEPPLNVEQRAGARLFLKAALLRAQGIQRGDSAQQIAQSIKSAGCPQVLLVVGAGGTGKSAMVHALKSQMQKRGAGYLVVTAYTGVASAPFGGPTLLALMSLSITCKNARDARQLSDVAVAAARAKFFSECGVSLDDVGGIVIDEVSFITAAVFGHVDHVLRAMTGNLDVPCGGVPILLCGDNHQKPPPGDSFWYKELVESLPGLVIKSKRARSSVLTMQGRVASSCSRAHARWSWSGSCEPRRCAPRLERTTHLSQPSDATTFFCGDRIYHSSECNSACAIRLRGSHQSVQPF